MSLAATLPDASIPASPRPNPDPRADAILDRITATFARKGLDGCSMQELAGAAGMSVGNSYRYYPSKLALIAALVERCACDVRAQFDAVRRADAPFEAMRTMLYAQLMETDEAETTFWLQVDAAAATHPEIAAVKRRMNEAVRANIRETLAHACPDGARDAARLDDLADFMFVFCGSLFRERAFERGEDASGRFRRMVARLFGVVERELAAPAAALLDPDAVPA